MYRHLNGSNSVFLIKTLILALILSACARRPFQAAAPQAFSSGSGGSGSSTGSTADTTRGGNQDGTSSASSGQNANASGGFTCDASFQSPSVQIEVDANGIPTRPAILALQVSSGTVTSRVVGIRGNGIQSISVNSSEESSVHFAQLAMLGIGYLPVTITLADAANPAEVRTCVAQAQLLANVRLPAAPTCELSLSSTVLREGDSFTAQLIPQGMAKSGTINGAAVSASGSLSLKAGTAGTFVVSGTVSGDGGSGRCQATYTVREKCKADYYVDTTIGARNAPRFDVGGGVEPTGTTRTNWQSVGGDAPVLLLSGLKGGDKVELTAVSGAIHYCNPAEHGWYWWSCYMACDSMGPLPDSSNSPALVPVAQFANDAGIVQTAPVKTINNSNAMILHDIHGVQLTVPENGTRLYGGYPDSYSADNSPTSVENCSVRFHVTPKCE